MNKTENQFEQTLQEINVLLKECSMSIPNVSNELKSGNVQPLFDAIKSQKESLDHEENQIRLRGYDKPNHLIRKAEILNALSEHAQTIVLQFKQQ